ncbi:MAG: DUF1343 domain-containing protein [Bacteroidota bacterium]|nr:DUF1343 domain-containing protein [Bacteroidota bacterium]
MKKVPLYKLIKKKEAIGLLCNQSGWHKRTGKYSFQSLADTGKLKKVFIPEHGLFGEWQDQVKVDDTSAYKNLTGNIEWISLYNSVSHSLTASASQLRELDTLIIDIQDTGCRYYTYTSTAWLLLKKITDLGLNITVIVFDKPNPAGRQVEGTRIKEGYASFIGLEGLPHRHGLTIGELCVYFKNRLQGKWQLIVDAVNKKEFVFIPPSPNIPTLSTCAVYSGQCLWEGTNISEGRGTTLPFETIGAPFLNWVFTDDWNNSRHPVYNRNCYIRPLLFIPVFHKFAGEICRGIHLLVHRKEKYHSLSHSLQLIKYIKKRSPAFEWRQGSYEAFNDKKAIELLIGDQLLLDYTENKTRWKEVKLRLEGEEEGWIKEVSPFLIYKSPLQKLKIK